jgi:tripartite-type tricarboxylate transporter receptor subunit TctC
MFKKIAAILLMASVTVVSAATTYNFIIPNPAGSSSDVVARAVAEEYAKISGNKLVIDYAPGGDHIVAANRFLAVTQPTVSLGSTTMHVFNHVTKDSIPYKDSDFDHVGWIGWTPHVWYVRTASSYTLLSQVVDNMKKGQRINVGVDGLSTQANVMSIKRSRSDSVSMEMIIYKGSPQVLADVLGGHVDIGVASLSSVIIGQAAAGNIRILATTNATPIVVAGQPIPVADRILDVEQFNGGFLLSVSAKFDTEENQNLKRDLHRAINSPAVKEALARINITVDGRDGAVTSKILKDYRKSVSILK